ncbi:hypothetical protein EUX98_g6811 [Antrodiella citrinella]|uniref:Uncharacterized protein n=1 Tax=Antrodiella citrinella TaxID=2447956 RepID=A0A4S4MN36_9APHY|nr:hypothetical protein EUX98_g6811 [Antrodiella citrinella]
MTINPSSSFEDALAHQNPITAPPETRSQLRLSASTLDKSEARGAAIVAAEDEKQYRDDVSNGGNSSDDTEAGRDEHADPAISSDVSKSRYTGDSEDSEDDEDYQYSSPTSSESDSESTDEGTSSEVSAYASEIDEVQLSAYRRHMMEEATGVQLPPLSPLPPMHTLSDTVLQSSPIDTPFVFTFTAPLPLSALLGQARSPGTTTRYLFHSSPVTRPPVLRPAFFSSDEESTTGSDVSEHADEVYHTIPSTSIMDPASLADAFLLLNLSCPAAQKGHEMSDSVPPTSVPSDSGSALEAEPKDALVYGATRVSDDVRNDAIDGLLLLRCSCPIAASMVVSQDENEEYDDDSTDGEEDGYARDVEDWEDEA